jgi:hypothetical protein
MEIMNLIKNKHRTPGSGRDYESKAGRPGNMIDSIQKQTTTSHLATQWQNTEQVMDNDVH